MSLDQILSYKTDKYNPARSQYETIEVEKWHTVRRGETIKSIARKYGVSQKQLKRWNNIRGNSVKRGKKLRIVTTQRIKIAQPSDKYKTEAKNPLITATADSIKSDSIVIDNGQPEQKEVTTKRDEPKVKDKVEKKPQPKPKKPKYTWYKVRKGDNLGKIAQKYGVTVNQIKRLNGIKGSRINIGQRIRIPQK